MADSEERIGAGREQIISTILGIVVVIIVGYLVYRYFQKGTEVEITPEGEQTEEQITLEQIEPGSKELPTTYKVKEGDNLWRIAEAFYRSGYNWVDLAEENDLTNADLLAVGQVLNIPDVAAREETVTQLPKTGMADVEPGEYTVQEGDWLSKIALRAYGDMFAWEKIYQANQDIIGPNPDLLEVGQVLTIPQ